MIIIKGMDPTLIFMGMDPTLVIKEMDPTLVIKGMDFSFGLTTPTASWTSHKEEVHN